ncbi:MAG TPA: two-component regulator propeller domain-containing protein [Puia sp.]|nr:two-component regulator propeller domain-containing protein [Puia sp.]
MPTGKEFLLLLLVLLPIFGEAATPGLPFFSRLRAENGLSHNKVNCILQDRRGFIWMGTEDGLNRYDGKNFVVFNSIPGDSLGLSGNIITGIAEDGDGVLWVATADGGLTAYDRRLPEAQQFKQFRHRDRDAGSLPENSIIRLAADEQGHLWLITAGQIVCRLDKATGNFDRADAAGAPGYIAGYFTDRRGNRWDGLPDRTLHYRAAGAGQEVVYRNAGGRRDAPEDMVGCFAEDGKGMIWMGGKYSGLYVYDRFVDKFRHYFQDPLQDGSLADNHVNCITIDRSGIVWIGADKGVSFYNPLFEPFVRTFLPAGEKDVAVYDFYREDATGILWIATSDGLFMQKGEGARPVRRVGGEQGLPPDVVRFCRDTVGKRRAMALSALTEVHTIPDSEFYDARADGSGNFWISTYGSGLLFFDAHAKTISHIPASSNLTEGIQTDGRGNIWMICNGHLHKYDPLSHAYSCYDLPITKRGGINGYIYKDNLGNLYTAGTNFFITFRPETVEAINMSPRVWFTDLRVFDKERGELLQQKEIVLQHDENAISFEYAAPDFSGDNISYSYQLARVDRDWIAGGKRTTASYSGLSPGEYVFQVRATNWKGCESNRVSSVRFAIRNPFWQSWWFCGLMGLFVALVCFGIYHYRIKEFLKRQAIRNRIALDLHDNIGSTLSSISIYSQVARVYLDQQEGGQLRELLARMDKTASLAVDEMSDMVWAINPKNDDMRSIVRRLEAYAAPLCAAKGIRFEFIHDPTVDKLNLEMSRRKNLYFIYKEAVNNAMKYSGCTLLEVGILVENNILRLVVKDNGRGFDLSSDRSEKRMSLSGNGLANMSRRAAEMNAAFTVNSQPGAGTSVELSFRVYN